MNKQIKMEAEKLLGEMLDYEFKLSNSKSEDDSLKAHLCYKEKFEKAQDFLEKHTQQFGNSVEFSRLWCIMGLLHNPF